MAFTRRAVARRSHDDHRGRTGHGRDRRPHPLDQRGAELRRRLRRADRGHAAEHRGDRARSPPGLPKIAVHWPLIDFECGPVGGADDFIEWFFKADRGELEPFVLVVEGSIPNERIKEEGYWCGFGNNPDDRPADDDQRVARPPRPQGARRPGRRHVRDLRRHPRDGGEPHRRDGCARLPRVELEVQGRPPDRLRPGCPIHPDNLSETILYLLYQATGQAPMIPLDDAAPAAVAVRGHRARGL